MLKRNGRCNGCDELSRELAETKRELKEAEKLLQAIADMAVSTARPAAAELSRGNVPRGHYAYLKAQAEMGNEILALMGLPQVGIKQRRPALFGRGLFSGFFR